MAALCRSLAAKGALMLFIVGLLYVSSQQSAQVISEAQGEHRAVELAIERGYNQ